MLVENNRTSVETKFYDGVVNINEVFKLLLVILGQFLFVWSSFISICCKLNPTNPSYRKFGTFRTCQYAVLPKIRYLGRARGMQLKITTNHG